MESTSALATLEPREIQLQPEVFLQPAVSVKEAVERQKMLADLVSQLLIPATVDKYGNVNFTGADYGQLPGTKERTLFQNGAEKLALFFQLSINSYCTEKVEDWDKGFFKYTYRAIAKHGNREIVSIERSCHTRETKYAWVWVEAPKPPKAEEEAMKAEKIGRNSKAWKDGSQTWVWQERRPNPDPFSLQFVVEAMAQKRAYVAVVKKALAATGFFSKEIDFEDYRETVIENPPPSKTIKTTEKAKTETTAAPEVTQDAFWEAVKAAGIQTADASPIAKRAATGAITWQEAIDQLPQ